jgi:3-isopropylmalate/(R)-2-methylmalate dehydratase small subunit
VIIAPSFADIFRANCHKIGLLVIELPAEQVETLAGIAEKDPTATVTIDLEAQTVSAPGIMTTFDIDPFVKHSLINGLDAIATTLERAHMISKYEELRPGFKPSLRGSGNTNNGERHG